VDFSFANLQHALLDGAHLEDARFLLTNLNDANLSRAHLQHADLIWAHLRGASLVGASLQGARLAHAKLEGADLRNAQLQAASLSDAQLQGTNFHGASLQAAVLSLANFQGAVLEEAGLQGAKLLDLSDLTGVSLERARVWRAKRPERFDLANFQGCNADTTPWDGTQSETFTVWRDDILKQIPQGIRRAEALHPILNPAWRDARELLNALDPGTEDDGEDAAFWKKMCSVASKSQNQDSKLATFIADLACSREAAPYIAHGLLRNGRIGATRALAGDIANKLLKGKSDPAACPGVLGVADADWTMVYELRERTQATPAR
jgi:hypothetical protein